MAITDHELDNEALRKEVEELGRMTTEQELVLYNIALRQDELGRQQTNMLLSKIVDDPVFQPLIDRELLTYEVFNHAKKASAHAIASLYVTLKGMRYCIMFADEISEARPYDVAGVLKSKKEQL